MAMNVPFASKSWALNTGFGKLERTIRTRKSASETERTPSLTSASASRSKADPADGPAWSSAARSATVQDFRWTASHTTARTSSNRVRKRAASATARGASAKRTLPVTNIRSGIRSVRCTRTNAALCRLDRAGISRSTTSGPGERRPCRRTAAGPVIRLAGPA